MASTAALENVMTTDHSWQLQDGARLGLDDAFHCYFADGVYHRDRNTFPVHVHADKFSVGRKWVLLSGEV